MTAFLRGELMTDALALFDDAELDALAGLPESLDTALLPHAWRVALSELVDAAQRAAQGVRP
jgi:hypothetical protein